MLTTSCDGNGVGRATTPVPDAILARPVTLTQAESLLSFEVTLPSFLPEGTSRTPELSVMADDEGRPELLVAAYWEEKAARAGTPRLRIRFHELSGHSSLPDNLDFEVVEIDGVPVEFAVNPFGADYAEAVAAWSHKGVGLQAEFFWLTDEQPGDGEITEAMRRDALEVIESMIR
jgi:hypothetical protein